MLEDPWTSISIAARYLPANHVLDDTKEVKAARDRKEHRDSMVIFLGT